MITYQVDDMSCGHCVKTITDAVLEIDRAAAVSIDLPSHRVEIQPASATEEQLRAAIEKAGYTPVAA